MLTEAQLRAFLPRMPHPRSWHSALVPALERFEISTRPRIAAFLAQVAHESAEFTRLEESLSYSAERLCVVWPSRFPSRESALPYARQPEKLANKVYANRMGNGDAASGDGWRYRGRGLIQLTARSNYRAAGRALGLLLEESPERVLEREIAALTAAWFWHSRGCNELADSKPGRDEDLDFERIAILVNGGRTGIADRRALWHRALTALE